MGGLDGSAAKPVFSGRSVGWGGRLGARLGARDLGDEEGGGEVIGDPLTARLRMLADCSSGFWEAIC